MYEWSKEQRGLYPVVAVASLDPENFRVAVSHNDFDLLKKLL